MGATIADAEWAEVFEVCVHACTKGSLPALSPCTPSSAAEGWPDGWRLPQYLFVMCRCVGAMQETCLQPLRSIDRSRTGKRVGDVCYATIT